MNAFRADKTRGKIFQLFLYSESLRFSEILCKTRIPSSLLAYFLKKMLSEGVLERKCGLYRLSPKAEKMIPFFVPGEERISPLVVVLVACVDNGKILLVKRNKRPFKGFWSLESGRLLISESIEQSARRIMREKFSKEIDFEGIKSVVFEMLVERQSSKHGFVFFLVRARPLGEIRETAFLKWFSIARLPKRGVIASDYWMIKNKLDSKADVVEEFIEEKGKTTLMRLA